MDTLHYPLVKMEEDYALSPCYNNSWDWKRNVENYSVSQTPSPQSLSPAVSFESPYSSGSQSQGMEEMPCSSEMGPYSLLHYPTHCQHQEESNGNPIQRKHGLKVSMTTQRRRKASEREKMRMRAIAEALHTLRKNLPPIYSQGRQPLTKIQTLKCTINYISELSNLLQCSPRHDIGQ
ncbi:hypothetical protein GDO86_010451 [Hymenochirus boettgeri]|uniref:Mesogenin-1 n=1 Tax=Hymenochirus boettgeri TaxID=247094 RepID=A0A8T2JQK6_9PIPI|nr:hypothetical protein GDO86_010451 [Hymenochirus boettgeri]